MRRILRKIKSKTLSFWRMPFRFKTMLAINYVLCGIAKGSIHLLPLPRLSTYFGQFNKMTTVSTITTQQQIQRALVIGKSVRIAAKYTPWDSSCLTQAMVAKFWCSIFKIPYVLYIGFAKSTAAASGYDAHAWITAGPIVLTGGSGSFGHYTVVSSYLARKSPSN